MASSNPRFAGLVCAALLVPVYVVGSILFGEERGFLVFCVTMAFAGVIYVRGSTSKTPAFISIMICLYIIHIISFIYVPIPEHLPGFIMISISVADSLLIYYLTSGIERLWFSDETSRK